LAFVFASLFLRLFGPLDVGWAPLLILSMGFALLFSLVGAVMGVQRIFWSKACGEDVVSLGPPVVVAGMIALGFCTLTGVLPLRLVLLASALAGLGFVVVRYRSRLLVGVASRLLAKWETPTIARERLLIVGGGDAGQIVAWMISNQLGGCDFHVVGFVDDDLYKQGARIRGVDVIGRREDIPDLVKEHDIGIIVYAIHNIAADERDEIMALCRQASIPVVEMPDFLGRLRTVASILADIQSVKRNIHPQGD
jgi:FlaA1/EpsC-like NDP-sugar epimerase